MHLKTRSLFLSAALALSICWLIVNVSSIFLPRAFSVIKIVYAQSEGFLQLGVYEDLACTVPISAIDWGNISVGSSKSKTCYLRNEGDLPIVLKITTASWDPSILQPYFRLTWDYKATVIEQQAIAEAVITLRLNWGVPKLNETAFSFNIIINVIEWTETSLAFDYVDVEGNAVDYWLSWKLYNATGQEVVYSEGARTLVNGTYLLKSFYKDHLVNQTVLATSLTEDRKIIVKVPMKPQLRGFVVLNRMPQYWAILSEGEASLELRIEGPGIYKMLIDCPVKPMMILRDYVQQPYGVWTYNATSRLIIIESEMSVWSIILDTPPTSGSYSSASYNHILTVSATDQDGRPLAGVGIEIDYYYGLRRATNGSTGLDGLFIVELSESWYVVRATLQNEQKATRIFLDRGIELPFQFDRLSEWQIGWQSLTGLQTFLIDNLQVISLSLIFVAVTAIGYGIMEDEETYIPGLIVLAVGIILLIWYFSILGLFRIYLS